MPSIPSWIWYLAGGIAVIAFLAVASEYWGVAEGVGKMLPGGEGTGG